MQLDDRDIICETDYSPLSHAELVAQIEWHASAMSGATAYDLERITGPARALLARAEAAEEERAELRAANEALAELAASETERRVALAERVAELEAALGELDALAPDYELPNGAAVAEAIASGYILTAGCRDIHGKVAGVAAVERNNEMLRARVAELEAQLERKEQLLNIAIDRLPEEEQEIVALRWALSGPFTNELPTMPAPAAQEPTP